MDCLFQQGDSGLACVIKEPLQLWTAKDFRERSQPGRGYKLNQTLGKAQSHKGHTVHTN